MRRLVFFVGGAGAGKTTLAKELARRRGMVLLDMDTLLRPAAESIMAIAGHDPKDRDSTVYKSLCRDLGYRITMDAALENVDIGTDTIVIGPFSKETEDRHWIGNELAKIGASLQTVEVKVVIVYLENQEQHYRRIKARGLAMDSWKLAHWDEFSRSLAKRELQWELPAQSILYLDNSQERNEETITTLEQFVFHESN